jgi:putative hydrolase of the HAD superfamily
MALPAVTFDFGQTLCDLDTAMLAARLAERGIRADAGALEAATTEAWRTYDAAIAAGLGGHPWKVLMRRLLELGGVEAAARDEAVDWLWTEQPKKNLWRRPIAAMIELCRELERSGVRLGLVSNSEGRLAELVDEIGWAADFPVVADSGVLGIEKPDPAIFRWAAERLGAPAERIVHVGDSWGADVEGARRAGMRAIWFRPRTERALPEGVLRAEDAAGVRGALARFDAPSPQRTGKRLR